MNKRIIALFFLAVLVGCARVPFTGRRQVKLIPSQELHSLAVESYRDFMNQHKLSDNSQQVAMVRDAGDRISKAVEQYARDHGLKDRVEGYEWEFNLIESDQMNAFAMPGGKVAFYTGIMPVCKNESGVAVVMAHDIAHVIARHGNERMSQQLIAQMGGMALALALEEEPQRTREIFMAAYGIGATVGVILPYSRLHESEADKIGQYFMAMAGYHPSEAIAFWERMQAMSEGAQPPQFISTHPSHETRIQKLRDNLSGAMKYYNP